MFSYPYRHHPGVKGKYAYQRGGAKYARVNSEVWQWTGKGIDTFQGSYTGSPFRVGGN